MILFSFDIQKITEKEASWKPIPFSPLSFVHSIEFKEWASENLVETDIEYDAELLSVGTYFIPYAPKKPTYDNKGSQVYNSYNGIARKAKSVLILFNSDSEFLMFRMLFEKAYKYGRVVE